MSEHDDDTCPHFVMRTLLESEKRYTEQVRVENSILMKEVARLKAEVERLRASSFVTAVPVEQYERVIKAGDLLCFHYISLARKRWPDDPLPSSVTDWNAAKEGKGQP